MKKLAFAAVFALGVLSLNVSAQAILTGRVHDSVGSGIPKASVTFNTCPFPGGGIPCARVNWQTTTNSFGNFSFPDPVWAGNTYVVTITHKGYDAFQQAFTMNDDFFLDAEMHLTNL